MKISLLFLLVSIQLTAFSQKNITGDWETGTFPNFEYSFDDQGNISFSWINDLGSYERNGQFELLGDTIIIRYEPVIKARKMNSTNSDSLSIKLVRTYDSLAIKDHILKVTYTNNDSLFVSTDSVGMVTIPRLDEIKKIFIAGQLYLNPNLLTKSDLQNIFDNEFYYIDPKQFESSSILILVDTSLIHLNLKSNEEKLLILNKKKIFRGTDYDPNAIYIGNFLKRKKRG